MPQAWSMYAPYSLSKSSMRLLGAAEPPMGMQRMDEVSHWGSFSRMAWMAIHTVGTAPTTVTRSLWTISMMSRGWGLGPPKIWVAPLSTPAKGTHQALAWNIGTMCRMTSFSEMPRTSVIDEAIECRKIARCVYTAPLGWPVVPDV